MLALVGGECRDNLTVTQTARVQRTNLAATEVNDALRFIVHFIGDVHQPLHDEALELGGNDIDVTFAGSSTNLHAIWGAYTNPARLLFSCFGH